MTSASETSVPERGRTNYRYLSSGCILVFCCCESPPYQGDRKISYVSYHTRAISMGITKAESRTLIDAAHHAKSRLCRMRVGAPAALA